MKSQVIVAALTAAQSVTALAVNKPYTPLTDGEVIDILLQNKGLFALPQKTTRVLEAVTKAHRKRDPQLAGFDFSSLLGGGGLGSLLGGAGGLGGLLGGGAAAPVSKAPEATVKSIQDSESQVWPGAKRRKVRYGPYRLPATSEKNLMSSLLASPGMANTFDLKAPKPCEGECTILQMYADLEYADGSSANNSNGAWLHHTVLVNRGPGVLEPNCGMLPLENMFMSGNERTVSYFAQPNSTIKSGYTLHPQDQFVLTTQLMNMDDREKWAWVTLNFDYLEGAHPEYKQGKKLWMTIGQFPSCTGTWATRWGESNMTMLQQPKVEQFSEHSNPWIAPKDGYILSTGGHLHDGGVSIEIFQNEKRICESVPIYSKSKEMAHSHSRRQMMGTPKAGNADIEHIERQQLCVYNEGIPLKKGDNMYLQANYDFKRYPGMKNSKGELDEVMGIVGTMVAF